MGRQREGFETVANSDLTRCTGCRIMKHEMKIVRIRQVGGRFVRRPRASWQRWQGWGEDACNCANGKKSLLPGPIRRGARLVPGPTVGLGQVRGPRICHGTNPARVGWRGRDCLFPHSIHDDISPGTLDQRLLSAEMSNRAALQAARGRMLTASAGSKAAEEWCAGIWKLGVSIHRPG